MHLSNFFIIFQFYPIFLNLNLDYSIKKGKKIILLYKGIVLFCCGFHRRKGENRMDQERNRVLSAEFTRFLRQKMRFLLFIGIFFLLFYSLFPLLIHWFPERMNRPVWGPFSWAWIYAFAHFAIVWILGLIYLRQANRWDRIAAAFQRNEVFGEASTVEAKEKLLVDG